MSLSYEKRKNTILKRLEENERVQVSELAEVLEVSGETIRRDLDRLEKENKLKKVYGGAVKAKYSKELSFNQKMSINDEEKTAICKAAASLVENGENIMIGHGTTAVELVRYLSDKEDVTIITPSIPVLLLAREVFKGKVILVGGEYEPNQQFTSGSLSEMIFDQLKANKVFIAAGGVSNKDGITDYDLYGSDSSRKMIGRAEEVIVLSDSTKFGKSTFAHICPLTDVSMIITTNNLSDEWKENLREKEVELLIAEEI